MEILVTCSRAGFAVHLQLHSCRHLWSQQQDLYIGNTHIGQICIEQGTRKRHASGSKVLVALLFKKEGSLWPLQKTSDMVWYISFVHTLLLRPRKTHTALWHFYLFKGSLYLNSSLKHLCPRDPCWEEQKELAWLKQPAGPERSSHSLIPLHFLSALCHTEAYWWDAQVSSEQQSLVWFQKEEKVVPALGTKSHARTPSTFGLRFLQSHCPGELSGFDLPGSPAVGDKVSLYLKTSRPTLPSSPRE